MLYKVFNGLVPANSFDMLAVPESGEVVRLFDTSLSIVSVQQKKLLMRHFSSLSINLNVKPTSSAFSLDLFSWFYGNC